MKFIAEINIMPHKELLDPQGKTVAKNMKNIDIFCVEDVRIGKHITMTLEADSQNMAQEIVTTACQKLLANPIMEHFTFELLPLETPMLAEEHTEAETPILAEEHTEAETPMLAEEHTETEAPVQESIEVEVSDSDSTSTF
jgi:phosphoribosylformylglycinamidine synthase